MPESVVHIALEDSWAFPVDLRLQCRFLWMDLLGCASDWGSVIHHVRWQEQWEDSWMKHWC